MFGIDAVRLVRDRGVATAQASRDLDVAKNVLPRWIRDLASDLDQALPGQGNVKAEQQEIDLPRPPPAATGAGDAGSASS